MEAAADTEKPEYNGEELQKEGSKWIERIRAAEKREHDWRKDAKAAEKAYAVDTKVTDGTLYDFNILHSNVETIVPAIYNSTPVPDVRRRFVEETEAPQQPQPQQGPDGQPIPPPPQVMQQFQIAMMQHQAVVQRDKDAKDFGDMLERAITVQIDDNKLDREIEQEAQDAFLAGRGIIRVKFEADDDGETVTNERLEFEAVSWRDFRMGPATRWQNVPWIAFRHVVSREAAEGYSDKEMVDAQAALQSPSSPESENDDIVFWEVWCSTTRKVKFVREHDCKMMKMADDPLGLRGFYPVPPIVQPITLTANMTPVCPFSIYKKLADELDTITKRINKIMKGLKVRGFVVGQASKILDLQAAGDNELVVDPDLEGLAQTGGIDKAVLWWPVEQSVKVLKELYAQREIVKASIYEITGISDIIRGASQASETATAQQIKTQWGALRIQKMQRLIERQVRDVFGIMAEIIVSKFSPQTLYQMTGIQITEGMQALMQQPIMASYRVNVESDSTVRADLTRAKADMAEFITGTGNYFKTMSGVVAAAPEMGEPVADIYQSFARVFNLGKQAEDALEKMGKIAKEVASKPRPNPEAEAAKAEMEMKAQDRQAEMQMKEREFQMKEAGERRKAMLDAQQEQRKLAVEQQKAGIDLQVAQTNLQIKQVELAMKREEAALSLQTKQAESAIKIDGQRQSAAIKADQARQKADQPTAQ